MLFANITKDLMKRGEKTLDTPMAFLAHPFHPITVKPKIVVLAIHA